MTHPPGFSSFPPPGPAPQQPAAIGDPAAVKAAKFVGLLIGIAVLAVATALALVWLTELLHQWWPAIPAMGFGLAIKFSGLIAAWYAFTSIGKEIFDRWLKIRYGPKS